MIARAVRGGPAILVTFVVLAVVALSLRPTGTEPAWLVVAGRVVPLTLLVAAVAQLVTGQPRGSVAAALAALSWAGVTWGIASVTRSDALVGVGLLVAPLLVPWLVLQVTALPTRWRPTRTTSLIAVAFVGIGLTGVVRALVYEPMLDLRCGPFCGHSPVALASSGELAAILGATAAWMTVIVSISLGLGVLTRLLRLSRAGLRAGAAAVLVVGAMVALAGAALIGLSGVAAPKLIDIVLVIVLQSGACVAIAVAALLVTSERLSVRRSLADVSRLLSAQDEPLTVEAILRRAVGDPELRVGYWTDDIGYVGADGRPLEEAVGGRQRTELTSRGRPVALLVHDNDSLPADLVVEQFGPQARLAIQNESLQLQLRRRVDELRASRRRIVEVGEAERRSLERDLHDGAQQLLLALSFELRRGERAAAAAGDAGSTAIFGEARDAAARILDELRILAHGIHPDILTGAGLEEAMASYAATVAPPPRLTFDLPSRLPQETESAVYAIVTRLIQAAPGSAVTIRRDTGSVRVSVDGVEDAPEYVMDRLGAAGGTRVKAGQGLELVLPCA